MTAVTRKPADEESGHASKLGVALSGGGAWGGAHLGVLRVLDEAGIRPACIAGTSSGAIVGALHAAGVSCDGQLEFAEHLRKRSLRLLGLPRLGFFQTGEMEHFLERVIGEVRVEELRVPVAIVATEFRTAKPVVFREGRLAHALSASAAIPVIFSPVVDGDAVLVDGGLTDNLPTQVCRGLGADVVLAVNVVPGFGSARRYENLFDVAMGTLEMLVRESTERGAAAADLCVHPDVGTVNPSDLSRIPALVVVGERAMRAALPRLRELLGEGTAGD